MRLMTHLTIIHNRLNRTKVELKFDTIEKVEQSENCLNRTKVELKYVSGQKIL